MNNLKSCTTYLARMLPGGEVAAVGRQSQSALRLTVALGASLLIGACASTSDNIPEPAVQAPATVVSARPEISRVDAAMIKDIVAVSRQIFTPFNSTLQFRKGNENELLQQFVIEFAKAGYGIQRVSADQGSNYFSYNKGKKEDENGKKLITFDVTIGAVNVGRDYKQLRNDRVSPASPFRLSGTRVPVKVTDVQATGFRPSDDPANTTAVYIASLNLEEQAPPVISLLTDDLVDRVVDENTQLTSVQALNSSRLEVNNLFFADSSNFLSILDDYKQIDRQVVVFGNDSMILGNVNKLLIEQLVQERLKPDDLIGLVGCSNGPTALAIGNEGLALGRAERVTEALVSQGVPRDRILDEGCWAPVSAGDKFPSRGVVLELWRKA